MAHDTDFVHLYSCAFEFPSCMGSSVSPSTEVLTLKDFHKPVAVVLLILYFLACFKELKRFT
jgi:hypothetical protein